ncbi:MAG: UbiA family prenyltransferase [Candidatus Poribacteria bacterium]|nr:UbiA family prenyltransferase [Candidatus Poribacteria bacterium]
MNTLKAYLELIRYPLFAIPIVATLPGALIASEGAWNWHVGLTLLIALLGYFAGMMKNDYFHRDQDYIAHPNRPIPSNRLTPRQVMITASGIYIVCVILGFTLHIKAGLLVIALVMISHSYNAIFKERGILGSISLPIGIGLLNIFGALAVSGGVPRLVWYAFAATTLYDCGTHITTTFKDIERDKKIGVTTTPLQLGIKPALAVSAAATIIAFIAAALPYWLEDVRWHYTVWIIFALIATSITRVPLYLNPNEKNGYLALQGSMIGAITFFPCLISVQISLWGSALLILPLMLLTMTLLNVSKREV